MKKWFVLLLTVLMLFGMTACKSNKEDDATPQTTDTVEKTYSVRELSVPDMHVFQIFDLSDGWVNIYGEYSEQTGFFFVNNKGEVLNNTVYRFAYAFSEGSAYVETAEEDWLAIDTQGATIREYEDNPYGEDTGLGRDMVEVDGEERWYITRNGEAITEPIFEWITGVNDTYDTYAILAEGEHRNVLINGDGEVTVVLPDDCTMAHRGENSIIAYYDKDDEGHVLFGLLDKNGKVLTEKRYDTLTETSNQLAVAVAEKRLVLLNELGEEIAYFDVSLTENVDTNLTAIAFEEDLIAVIGANDDLVLLQLICE